MQNTHSVESSRHQTPPQLAAKDNAHKRVKVREVLGEMAEAAKDNEGIFPPKGAIEHLPGYRAR